MAYDEGVELEKEPVEAAATAPAVTARFFLPIAVAVVLIVGAFVAFAVVAPSTSSSSAPSASPSAPP
jgi:hypothetical protein